MNSNQHFTKRHYGTFAAVVVIIVAGGLWAFNRLSSDAIGMALGLGFGVLGGIPAALLVFVASRRRSPYDYRDDDDDYRPQTAVDDGYRPQTVIIIQSPQATPQTTLPAPWERTASNEQRQFRIVPQTAPTPWERGTQMTLPPPPQCRSVYGGNDTHWEYPVWGVEMVRGAPVRLTGEVTVTTSLEFALATGARCIVRLDEWDAHVATQAQAQNWGQYAYHA